VCGSAHCAVQCAAVRSSSYYYCNTATPCVLQLTVVIIILQPPCCATIIIIMQGSSTDLRVVYGQVMYESAGGLRTGHLRICGWSTDLWVGIGWSTRYPCRGHGVPIGQIIIQITTAPGGVSCATIIMIIIR
jgi:hypothetical protein